MVGDPHGHPVEVVPLLVDGAFGRHVRIDPPVPDDIVGEMRLDDVIDEVAVLRHRDGVFIRPYLIMGVAYFHIQ